jgi:glutathione peroxidase
MKYLFSLIVLFSLVSFSVLEDIYDISFKTIDGKPVNLNNYRGKKILFIILPLSNSDTSVSFAELSSVQTKYASSLVVVGIPGIEAGYENSDAAKLKNLYKDQKENFILAEAMKIRKLSGIQQSPLFQWLTDKDKNGHYINDPTGPGYKFFVNERGGLYAVMGPKIKLTNPVIDKVLSHTLK